MTTSTTLNSLACEHNFRVEKEKHLDTPRGAYFFFHNHRHLFSFLHNVRNVKLNKLSCCCEAASVFSNYYLLLSTAQYKRNVRRVRRSTKMLVTTLNYYIGHRLVSLVCRSADDDKASTRWGAARKNKLYSKMTSRNDVKSFHGIGVALHHQKLNISIAYMLSYLKVIAWRLHGADNTWQYRIGVQNTTPTDMTTIWRVCISRKY